MIRFISSFLITLWILIIPSIAFGTSPDTLIIRGKVSDYGGNPIPNCLSRLTTLVLSQTMKLLQTV